MSKAAKEKFNKWFVANRDLPVMVEKYNTYKDDAKKMGVPPVSLRRWAKIEFATRVINYGLRVV